MTYTVVSGSSRPRTSGAISSRPSIGHHRATSGVREERLERVEVVLGAGAQHARARPAAALRLHHHRDDHRLALGAVVDEAAGGAAHGALERLQVGGAGLHEEVLDRLAHDVGALVEQGLGLGGVDPAPGDDLGAGEDGAVLERDA